MKKKNKLYLSGFFIAALGVFFFSSRNKKEVAPISIVEPQSLSTKQNTTKEIKNIEEAKVAKVAKVASDQKLRSRNPSYDKKIEPRDLKSHELLVETRWKIWAEVRAKSSQQVDSADQIVSTVSNFKVVKSENTNVDLQEFNKNLMYVVYDPRLKKAGIITGAIKVVTDRKDLLEESLKNSDAKISQGFDQIQTYYVESEKSLFNFQELYNFLKIQAYIKDIQIDISDRNYEKK